MSDEVQYEEDLEWATSGGGREFIRETEREREREYGGCGAC